MEVEIQFTPESGRSRQKEVDKLKQRLLELDLQELERIRAEMPYVQPQIIWAKRVHDQRKPTQASTDSGSKLHTVEEEEDFLEELDVEVADVETTNMESQVGQPAGVAMGQRLQFFAQQMTARHKPTTTRQYSQHWSAWQVF